MSKIIISTECVADLSEQLRKEFDVHYIYYDLQTEEGVFRDNDEIDALNIIEYMRDGKKKVKSVSLTPEKFETYFDGLFEECDEIVHICIGEGLSESYGCATAAKAMMGEKGDRIHIVNSTHLSSGLALVVVEAGRLRALGLSAKEIADESEKVAAYVSTSFIAYNADYLYYNGRSSKRVKKLCNMLNLHPVLHVKDGKLVLKRVYIGNYDRASARYIKSMLKKHDDIDSTQAFLTYAGCSHRKLEEVKQVIGKYVEFKQLHEVQASATVSCNCGPNTFGILFRRKEK